MLNDKDRVSGDCGFTLIELLVVMGIGALVLASIQMLAARRSVDLSIVASQVATGLRSARESAVAFGQPVALLIARDGGTYQFSTARAAVSLPRGVRIAFRAQADFNRAGLRDKLVFFVDGSSTGGTVLVSTSKANMALAVEPLSGAIKLKALP